MSNYHRCYCDECDKKWEIPETIRELRIAREYLLKYRHSSLLERKKGWAQFAKAVDEAENQIWFIIKQLEKEKRNNE